MTELSNLTDGHFLVTKLRQGDFRIETPVDTRTGNDDIFIENLMHQFVAYRRGLDEGRKYNLPELLRMYKTVKDAVEHFDFLYGPGTLKLLSDIDNKFKDVYNEKVKKEREWLEKSNRRREELRATFSDMFGINVSKDVC